MVCGQPQNLIWYFGFNAGLDFNTTPPTAITGQLNTLEGCATISDKNGDLLFYTDGTRVWNRKHRLMPNGTGLLGGYSSTQSALIVPVPKSKFLYYIFTVEDTYSDGGAAYSTIDVRKDNGLGDVIPESKNTILVDHTAEKITAVLHANDVDIWVLIHLLETNEFYAYLVTPNGLSAPVISKTGTVFGTEPEWFLGYMRASHNGTKIVSALYAANKCELYDFDNTTGVVANPVELMPGVYDRFFYGVEFSPNDSLLYLAGYSPFDHAASLYQLQVIGGPSQPTLLSVLPDYEYGCIHLGNDQKIYISQYNQSNLHIIHFPNVLGAGCMFEKNALTLLPETYSAYGLQNFPPYSFCPWFSLGDDLVICSNDSVRLEMNLDSSDACPVNFQWFDGSTDSVKTVYGSGTWWIEITLQDTTYVDSIHIDAQDVLKSTVAAIICEGETFEGYSMNGTFVDTLFSKAGCDSIRTLTLAVLPTFSSTEEKSITKGNQYYGYQTSGIYVDTLASITGCDSIRTLILHVVDSRALISYSFNECESVMSQGTHMDYSEFTPEYSNELVCASVTAKNVYRVFPQKHSCTPGVGNNAGMCVTILSSCTYDAGNDASVIIEFTLEPDPDSMVQVTRLSFFEKVRFNTVGLTDLPAKMIGHSSMEFAY